MPTALTYSLGLNLILTPSAGFDGDASPLPSAANADVPDLDGNLSQKLPVTPAPGSGRVRNIAPASHSVRIFGINLASCKHSLSMEREDTNK
jgi:hypothetical protein